MFLFLLRTLALICFLTCALTGIKYFAVVFTVFAVVAVVAVVVFAVVVAVVSTAKAELVKKKETKQTSETKNFFVFILLWVTNFLLKT